jgi:hypothetical protein
LREDGLLVLVRSGDIRLVVPAADPFPAAPAGTAETRVFSRDGSAVHGVVAAVTPDGALVDTPEGRRFIPDVRRAIGPAAPIVISAAPVIPEARGEGVPGRVVLAGGRVLESTILARNEDAVLVDVPGRGRVAVLSSAVAEVTAEPGRELPSAAHRETWHPDPSAPRAMALPTAFLQRRGSVLLDQALGVTSLRAGVLDHAEIAVSTAWPYAYADGAGWNVVGTLEAGIGLGDRVHVAAGVLAFAAEGGSAAYLFGAFTVGTPDLYLSAYVGPPLAGTAHAGDFGDRVAALSGLVRIGARLALVTENWVALGSDTLQIANALGARVLLGRGALDVGVARVPATDLPVPWVGFSVAFGAREEVVP